VINHGLQRDLAICAQREFERKTAEANLQRSAKVSNDADQASKRVASLPLVSLAARLRSLGRGILAHERQRFPA